MFKVNYYQSLQSYVSYEPEKKHLRLKAALFNNNIRADDIKRAIEESVRLTHQTRNLWNPKYWKE